MAEAGALQTVWWTPTCSSSPARPTRARPLAPKPPHRRSRAAPAGVRLARSLRGRPTRHAVLDVDWHVCGEYRHKLTEQDYGWLAMMHKMDRGEVVWVDVLLNKDGNAVLPRAGRGRDRPGRPQDGGRRPGRAGRGPRHPDHQRRRHRLDRLPAGPARRGAEGGKPAADWLQARWRQKHPPVRRAK